jgi:hypothetical protein
MSNQSHSLGNSEPILSGLDFDVRKEQLVPIFKNRPIGPSLKHRANYFGPWTAISGTGKYRGKTEYSYVKADDVSSPVNPSGNFRYGTHEFTNVKTFVQLLEEIKKRIKNKQMDAYQAGQIRKEFFRQFPNLSGGPIPGGEYTVSTQLTTGNSGIQGFNITPLGYTNFREKRTSLRIHSTRAGSEDTTSQGCIALPKAEFDILSIHMALLFKAGQAKLDLRVNGGKILLPATSYSMFDIT